MRNFRKLTGALGALAVIVISTVSLAATPVSFGVVPSGSSITIGSNTFPVAPGRLIGTLAPPGSSSCALGVSAALSNPTLETITIAPGISARLELCNDGVGAVTSTAGGTGVVTTDAGIRVRLSGVVNCEVPCTPMKFSSAKGAEGRGYDPSTGEVTLVDDTFSAGVSTCGFLVDAILGLPAASGNNKAVLQLQAEGRGPFPTCSP